MTTIEGFIAARLDEDERAARAATPGPWRYNPDKHNRPPYSSAYEEAVFTGPAGADAICIAGTGPSDDPQSMADAAYIARHDPARVLAECAAKRRILAMARWARKIHEEDWPDGVVPPVTDVVEASEQSYRLGQWHGHNAVLRTLAAIWSDHADFDPRIKPMSDGDFWIGDRIEYDPADHGVILPPIPPELLEGWADAPALKWEVIVGEAEES